MFPCSGEPGFEQDAEKHHTVLINKDPTIHFLSFEINSNRSKNNDHSDDDEDEDMSRIALMSCMPISISVTKGLFPFSLTLHHLWREIRNIKVIKCPPYYTPSRDIKGNLNPIQKNTFNTKKPVGGSRLEELAEHFVKITRIELAFLNATVKNQRMKMGIDKNGQVSLNFQRKRPL